jgi:DNA-binding MarR family transcriptional regulator
MILAMRTTDPVAGRASKEQIDQALIAVEHSLTHLARLARPSRIFGELTDALGRPLDRAAYSVLARIEEFGPIRLTDLASAMEIDISTASRHVRALEDRGLLARSGEPGDLRARRLQLTRDGEVVLKSTREARLAGIAERLRDWKPNDLCRLALLLEQLVSSFAGQPGAGTTCADKGTKTVERAAAVRR